MALTNAEKQRRFRERNVIVLTEDAKDIAGRLIDMEDQAELRRVETKLRKIARYIGDHLKHPDRTPEEMAIALGRSGIDGLHGPLTKKQAIEALRNPEPPQHYSWTVEAVTKDGKHWRNEVRLRSEEEAAAYIESFVPFDMEKRGGYVTAKIVRCDGEEPRMWITRRSRGGRPNLYFPDGTCSRLVWEEVGADRAPEPRIRARASGAR